MSEKKPAFSAENFASVVEKAQAETAARQEYFKDGKQAKYENSKSNRFNFNLILTLGLFVLTGFAARHFEDSIIFIASWPVLLALVLYFIGNFTDKTIFPIEEQKPKAKKSAKNYVLFCLVANVAIVLFLGGLR